jgi:hypothetical protein
VVDSSLESSVLAGLHEQPPAYKTRNWPAHLEALKRRGSLTIWFDPAMTWEATPISKHGRQPELQRCCHPDLPCDEVLFGMSLRQTTGFVESFLRLIGLDWTVLNFNTLEPSPEDLEGKPTVDQAAHCTC